MSAPEDFNAWLEWADLMAQLPPKMRHAMEHQEPEFAMSMARDYLAGDEATRLDVAAFFDSDGPKVVHDLKVEHEDGTPTSHDLDGWLGAP